MTEKLLSTKKNGMAVLLLTILWVLASIAALIFGIILVETNDSPILLIPAILSLLVCWIPFCGLKVLKPQEALVLTLFGNYYGTLKGEGDQLTCSCGLKLTYTEKGTFDPPVPFENILVHNWRCSNVNL